jgi:hypothetical protein
VEDEGEREGSGPASGSSGPASGPGSGGGGGGGGGEEAGGAALLYTPSLPTVAPTRVPTVHSLTPPRTRPRGLSGEGEGFSREGGRGRSSLLRAEQAARAILAGGEALQNHPDLPMLSFQV